MLRWWEALAVLAGDGAGAPGRRILEKEIESIQPNPSNTNLKKIFFQQLDQKIWKAADDLKETQGFEISRNNLISDQS